MAVAKAAFAEVGPDVSLDEIARRAQVGIGTLYRHFPTRDALVAAVYRLELEQVVETANRLLESSEPGEALRQWLRMLVDYIATKKVIAAALGAADPSHLYATSGTQITDTMTRLVDRAMASGDIRPDVDPGDILRALTGIAWGAGSPGWQESALRLVDIFMDGLRASSGTRS
jgi:AcrR family transcriptional regulator